MTQILSFKRFNDVYRNAVRDVYEYWTPEMQLELARYNQGWAPAFFDFGAYLRASSVRYYKAYRLLAEKGSDQTVCDVGGFWGCFPVTLKRLGYKVTITETLRYYGGSFTKLFEFITKMGVTVVDLDPFQPEVGAPGRFDVVMLMAVLEHYPHSLRSFMKNIVSLINPGGNLYIEVPNIAFWPKRIQLLLGRTPLVPASQIFQSLVPFIGHHHEFTIHELRDLVNLSGLVTIRECFYNYSPQTRPGLRMLLRDPIQFVSHLFLRDSRECLAVLCKSKD